ncbi:MAG: hypothetical protein M9895_10880 [Aquamicrobium sp.]|uniref:hypothetical protein n=1 Tax=Aquamicrobium sp. TaxID=1872579 RepID=UPI00349E9A44|nr:hypothetical protein [Aquamicrobium sp.]
MTENADKERVREIFLAIFGFFLQGIGAVIGLIIGLSILAGMAFIVIHFGSKFIRNFSDNVIYACRVEKIDVNNEVFIINNDSDYGFVVNVLVRREYRDGDVTVKVRLSSTEGDIEKRRTIYMKKDQASVVQLQFPEPTINAQQVQAFASCTTI